MQDLKLKTCFYLHGTLIHVLTDWIQVTSNSISAKNISKQVKRHVQMDFRLA